MLHAHHYCVAASLALVGGAPSFATDRYYRDVKAVSPSGRYVFEAKSPDNAGPEPHRPFQGDFIYTLTDTKDGTVLWSRKQVEQEGSPISGWVDDQGWTVARTSRDHLMTFAHPKGGMTAHLSILEQFPNDERERYVHDTTAGPRWSGSSRWYFLDIAGAPHFVVRAHWGRRIIVALRTGALVKDEGPTHDLCVASEHEWVLKALRESLPKVTGVMSSSTPEAGAAAWDAGTAIDMAARDSLLEAVPLLRELEKSTYSGACAMIPVFSMVDRTLPSGLVNPFSWCEYTIRKKAQTALRRLKETPSELPPTYFMKQTQTGNGDIFAPELVGPRADGILKIVEGMTPEEVLTLAGAPDAVANGRAIAWEFHIDGPEACTIQISWKQEVPPVVLRVARVTPPTWTKSDEIEW